MKRLTERDEYGCPVCNEEAMKTCCAKCSECDYDYECFKRLAEYEDTGLTPQEIEQMKARMPLHQWAGESPEKMSIFGVSVAKIIELTDKEKKNNK